MVPGHFRGVLIIQPLNYLQKGRWNHFVSFIKIISVTVERVFFTPANAAFYVCVLLSAEFIYLHSIIYLNSIGLSDYGKTHEEMWDSHGGKFQLLFEVVIRAVPKYSSLPPSRLAIGLYFPAMGGWEWSGHLLWCTDGCGSCVCHFQTEGLKASVCLYTFSLPTAITTSLNPETGLIFSLSPRQRTMKRPLWQSSCWHLIDTWHNYKPELFQTTEIWGLFVMGA